VSAAQACVRADPGHDRLRCSAVEHWWARLRPGQVQDHLSGAAGLPRESSARVPTCTGGCSTSTTRDPATPAD